MSQFNQYQQTIDQPVSCEGIGVHSGAPVTLTLKPAPIDTGIVFVRSDLKSTDSSQSVEILAHWKNITNTMMHTTLSNAEGVSISTVEHILATLAAFEITNCFIEISGAEVPIMDGSSRSFMELLRTVKIVQQQASKLFLKILKEVRVEKPGHWASLAPFSTFQIDFTHDFKGRVEMEPQTYTLVLPSDQFTSEVGDARTFGFYEDAEKLWAAGLAKGTSLDNTVVFKEQKLMNETRYPNEFVRHKVLDALGDLSLAGMPILGHYTAYNSGHTLNHELLTAVFSDELNYELVESVIPDFQKVAS